MTKRQTISKNRWNAKNYDQLPIRVPKGQREAIKQRIEAVYGEDKSLNSFVVDAINEKLERDGDSHE